VYLLYIQKTILYAIEKYNCTVNKHVHTCNSRNSLYYIYLSIYLSIYLPIYLSIYQSIYLSIYYDYTSKGIYNIYIYIYKVYTIRLYNKHSCNFVMYNIDSHPISLCFHPQDERNKWLMYNIKQCIFNSIQFISSSSRYKSTGHTTIGQRATDALTDSHASDHRLFSIFRQWRSTAGGKDNIGRQVQTTVQWNSSFLGNRSE
jgi:hypothetical protein